MAGSYRKIDTRIWNDSKFRALDDNAKLAFLFVLTHPHMTIVGVLRATVEGLAAERGWTKRKMLHAISACCDQGLLTFDKNAAFIGAPRFPQYNLPRNPNVAMAWGKCTEALPECTLLWDWIRRLEAITRDLGEEYAKGFARGLTKGFGESLPKEFRESLPKPARNRERERERERDITPKVPKGTGEKSLASAENVPPEKTAAVRAWLMQAYALDAKTNGRKLRTLAQRFAQLADFTPRTAAARRRVLVGKWGGKADTAYALHRHWGQLGQKSAGCAALED